MSFKFVYLNWMFDFTEIHNFWGLDTRPHWSTFYTLTPIRWERKNFIAFSIITFHEPPLRLAFIAVTSTSSAEIARFIHSARGAWQYAVGAAYLPPVKSSIVWQHN